MVNMKIILKLTSLYLPKFCILFTYLTFVLISSTISSSFIDSPE